MPKLVLKIHITKALGHCRTFHNSQILHEKKCLLTDPIVWRVSVYFQVYLLLRVCTQSLPKSQWFAFFFSKNMELITSLSLSLVYIYALDLECMHCPGQFSKHRHYHLSPFLHCHRLSRHKCIENYAPIENLQRFSHSWSGLLSSISKVKFQVLSFLFFNFVIMLELIQKISSRLL